jgi:oligopeptide transport system substrate-binding protein
MIQDVRAEGAFLVIDLKHRAPYFLEVLTLTACLPERRDVLDSHRGKWPEDGPVTGPYQITKHEIENKITLVRNEKYRSSHVSIPTVDYLVVPEESTGVSLFEKGEVDILTRIPPLDVERLKTKHLLKRSELLATYYIAFNTRVKPFDEIKNRKTIANAIRKKEIVEALGSGESVAENWLPPRWEPESPHPDRNPPVANAGFSAAVTIGFDSSSRNSLIMEKIASDIRESTKVKVSLFHQDWKTYIRTLQSDPPSIYRFAWLAPFDDPLPHLQVFTSRDPNNYTGWSNARYDALVETIAETPGGSLRTKLIQDAEKLLDDEAPVVPIFHYVQNHAVSSRVLNFSADPFGVIHLSELSLKK